MRKSLFISLESGDFAGKTTQANILDDHLNKLGVRAIYTRAPGGTCLGESIRALVKSADVKICEQAESLLMNAGTAQMVAEVIEPELAKGTVVVCDRFIDSTIAYQGFGRGVDLAILLKIINYATHGLVPDITFFLDTSAETRKARSLARGPSDVKVDRYENLDAGFHERVEKGFQFQLVYNPTRIVKIDANNSVERVASDIWEIVNGRISLR
jgi:dTMP kinase